MKTKEKIKSTANLLNNHIQIKKVLFQKLQVAIRTAIDQIVTAQKEKNMIINRIV